MTRIISVRLAVCVCTCQFELITPTREHKYQHELTWRGHAVPDEAWFEATAGGEAEIANAFGCWGFGLQPEVCADAWHDSYDGAPNDGLPRFGNGPRVTRGGAAMLYPWQQVGEWQLLCSAVRTPSVHWEFELSVRPVLSIVAPR